jgi:hypothetical protein
MQQDAVQRGLPAPSEEAAREQCLRPGVEPPDLATVKDFIRFYDSTSVHSVPIDLKTKMKPSDIKTLFIYAATLGPVRPFRVTRLLSILQPCLPLH